MHASHSCHHTVDSGILNVTVSGGGPVGLTFALLLESLLGPRVAITIYDARWADDGSRVVWKSDDHGNIRRQQVVTIQSRHFLKLPQEIQDQLFQPGQFSEMWPTGPDSIDGLGPRNVRIAHIEDSLLEKANEKAAHIRLVPRRFDPASPSGVPPVQHVLAICEGSRSDQEGSLKYFERNFGTADRSIFSLDGQPVRDVVLGLKVKSDLSDAAAVLLTVTQNRFLLNSVHGDGFLNMRLTDAEAEELTSANLDGTAYPGCIQSKACVFQKTSEPGVFKCAKHGTVFSPPTQLRSSLWARTLEGLKLFGVKEENLQSITAFRLSMVQRPRFSAELCAATPTRPATFGFLLGDTANAVHFWPGRGLNGGLASAISLARCLKNRWRGLPFRDSDFLRHEAAMAMLQYRHKCRAWRFMVHADDSGVYRAIKDLIGDTAVDAVEPEAVRQADIERLLQRMGQFRGRLAQRIEGLPSDEWLRTHLSGLQSRTLRELVESGAWDSYGGGGEEVEVDWLLGEPCQSQPP